jgi:hypothetical protein
MHLMPDGRAADGDQPEVGNSWHFRKWPVRYLLEGTGLAGVTRCAARP